MSCRRRPRLIETPRGRRFVGELTKDDDCREALPASADIISERPTLLLVAGIGASAGGLEALESFFDHVPTSSGIAFVVVTHQQPGHTSLLPQLLARHTQMAMVAVVDPTVVEANHVYLTTPGTNLVLFGGVLHCIPRGPEHALDLPVDCLFRSLAREYGRRAVAIVLSGNGSDGTLGANDIASASGMVMIQEPQTAHYPSMPLSVERAVEVDYALPVDELAGRLLDHAQNASLDRASLESTAADTHSETWTTVVLSALRDHTGHNFAENDDNTIRRRITRRMNLLNVASLQRYSTYIQASAGEADALFKEMLIGVTSFFRDAEAYVALFASVLPALLASRPVDRVLRVWVPGCSSGEEAYSLAIALLELLEGTQQRCSIRIFATDLNAHAIGIARIGIYPASIAAHVSHDRLERFFVAQGDCYRVRKELRDWVVFTTHDVIDEAPFTKLDLLSCRNVLIYFNTELQRRLILRFHYALREGGVLFLGSSENVGVFAELFEPIDSRQRIFRRLGVARDHAAAHFQNLTRVGGDVEHAHRQRSRRYPSIPSSSLGSADRVLLNELVPPCLILRERGDLMHVHGRTASFLEPASGAATRVNVFKIMRPELQMVLVSALHQSGREPDTVVHRTVRLHTDGQALRVDLKVRQLRQPATFHGLFVVSFESRRQRPDVSLALDVGRGDVLEHGAMVDLPRDLQRSRRSPPTTIQGRETSGAAPRTINEALQNANADLETSKTDTHFLNEELHTINAELNVKTSESSNTSEDMCNLPSGTDMATVFLDMELNIKGFTKHATRFINLLPSDIGRPIAHLTSKLQYEHLARDASEVLQTLVAKEVEVRGPGDNGCIMRVAPYRTVDNAIVGLAVTFSEKTRIKRPQATSHQLQSALQSSPTTASAQDRNLRFIWACGPVFGRPCVDVVGNTDSDLLAPGEAMNLVNIKDRVMRTRISVRDQIKLTLGSRTTVLHLCAEPSVEMGEVVGIVCVMTELPCV